MPETIRDAEQQKQPQPSGDAAAPQPGIEAPSPELEGPAPALGHGPGLDSPAGVARPPADARFDLNANRQRRVQTLMAM